MDHRVYTDVPVDKTKVM